MQEKRRESKYSLKSQIKERLQTIYKKSMKQDKRSRKKIRLFF